MTYLMDNIMVHLFNITAKRCNRIDPRQTSPTNWN